MTKILTAFILIVISFNTKGQEQIFYYKKIADNLIRKEFDSSLISKMTCKSFWMESGNADYGSAGSYNYEQNKYKCLKFTSLTFQYSFYSLSINDTFNFDLKINSKAKPIYKLNLFENVPECIRTAISCDFISKDSALTIAINDSIKFSNNLQIAFEQAPNTNSFYWVIEGERQQRKSSNIKSVSGYGEMDFRYINAKTGDIISRQKFFKNL